MQYRVTVVIRYMNTWVEVCLLQIYSLQPVTAYTLPSSAMAGMEYYPWMILLKVYVVELVDTIQVMAPRGEEHGPFS